MRQNANIMGYAPVLDFIKLPHPAALVTSSPSLWWWCVNSLVSFGRSPTANSSGNGDRSLLRSGLLFSEVWSGIGSPIAELAVEQLHQLIHTITETQVPSEQVRRVHLAVHLSELDGARANPLMHP